MKNFTLLSFLVYCILGFSSVFSQTISLPYDFESSATFTNFDGGTGSIIANPASGGINTSATVGQMVRNGGQPWAGAYLTTTVNVDFSVNPIICMKVYTDAPVPTNVNLKMEGCGGGCSREIAAVTTVSGEWEVLYWDFTGEPMNYNRLVFLFDIGTIGDGSATSTFLFDDIQQHPFIPVPLPFTPGSQYFCTSGVLDLIYPGAGDFNWYSAPVGGTLIQASSSSYTTPLLTADSSFYVQNMAITPFPQSNVGPSFVGGPAYGNATSVSQFFTSNLDNGFFHSIDMNQVVIGLLGEPSCTYTVTVFNITQGLNRSITRVVGTVDNTNHNFTFGTPLPMDLNDNMELRIVSNTGHPCYCNGGSSARADYLPYPNSYDPQLTFTSHTMNGGADNNNFSGFNYNISGDFLDPTRYQVNAIENCLLPIEVSDFIGNVVDDQHVTLSWKTYMEQNVSQFRVERSVDDLNFEIIEELVATNSTEGGTYQSNDMNAPVGILYYRLQSIDNNGVLINSKTIQVKVEQPSASLFQIAGNPVSDIIRFRVLDNSLKSSPSVQLFNQNGKLVYENESIQDLTNWNEIAVKNLPSGLYYLQVGSATGQEIKKMVIQH